MSNAELAADVAAEQKQRPQAQRQAVRSTPMEPTTPTKAGSHAIGFAALVFGGIFWLISSRYSLDGWIQGLNVLFAVVKLPLAIPTVAGWWSLLCVPLGVAYSLAEVRYNPLRGGLRRAIIPLLLAWLLIHGTDLGSTYLSASTPAATDWPLALWTAQTLPALGLWVIFLTYLPERMIMAGWRHLWR